MRQQIKALTAGRLFALSLNGAMPAALCACSISMASAQEEHFAPEEKLDAIDAALIAGATRSIDFASYSLTDRNRPGGPARRQQARRRHSHRSRPARTA